MQNVDDDNRIDRLQTIHDLYKTEYERLKEELKYQQQLHQVLHGITKQQRRQLYIGVNPSRDDKKEVVEKIVKKNQERIKEFEKLEKSKLEIDKKLIKVLKKVEKNSKDHLTESLTKFEGRRNEIERVEKDFMRRKNKSLQRIRQNIVELQAGSIMNSSFTSFHSIKSLAKSTSSTLSRQKLSPSKPSQKIKVISSKTNRNETLESSDILSDIRKNDTIRIKTKPNYQKLKLFNYEIPKSKSDLSKDQ